MIKLVIFVLKLSDMKRMITAALMLALPLIVSAQDIQGYVSYALPRTVLSFNVSADKEVFHAGPYAKFAQKYLGIEVRQQDQTTYTVTSIELLPSTEADQSRRFQLNMENAAPVYMQMTSQGLIAGKDASISEASGWKFPTEAKGSFNTVPSNFETESRTLYGRQGAVQQSTLVEKSPEKKAQEVAEMIFKIRDNRYKILVGDTDATYSGEAMKATIDELNRMEAECLTLFTGYSESGSQRACFEVIPDAAQEKQMYIAFRISDTDGIVNAENVSGKPYFLVLEPEAISAPAVADRKAKKPEQEIHYLIPAICNAKLSDGVSVLLQTRVPVYQLGLETTYPIYKQK